MPDIRGTFRVPRDPRPADAMRGVEGTHDLVASSPRAVGTFRRVVTPVVQPSARPVSIVRAMGWTNLVHLVLRTDRVLRFMAVHVSAHDSLRRRLSLPRGMREVEKGDGGRLLGRNAGFVALGGRILADVMLFFKDFEGEEDRRRSGDLRKRTTGHNSYVLLLCDALIHKRQIIVASLQKGA
ncbi:hypothetical protein PsorP6_007030 [Peronosclerospora sorghi]|uniref:Uncharacterized protein n=1 Tax=Peronosclerospora sorghi TaxID=230839 RepID=A0ACC0WB66_9STRA|nr:hypothetical protein PsorP6_007030 [Peronosclerospora sorghi]